MNGNYTNEVYNDENNCNLLNARRVLNFSTSDDECEIEVQVDESDQAEPAEICAETLQCDEPMVLNSNGNRYYYVSGSDSMQFGDQARTMSIVTSSNAGNLLHAPEILPTLYADGGEGASTSAINEVFRSHSVVGRKRIRETENLYETQNSGREVGLVMEGIQESHQNVEAVAGPSNMIAKLYTLTFTALRKEHVGQRKFSKSWTFTVKFDTLEEFKLEAWNFIKGKIGNPFCVLEETNKFQWIEVERTVDDLDKYKLIDVFIYFKFLTFFFIFLGM